MFTLAISCLAISSLPWFMDLTFQVPMQYCSLQHRTTSITSHIHNWVLFLLWLCLFILSGVISPLFSSSIPTTLGSSFFSVLSFCLFITVHGVLKARILKSFAIPFSSGPCFVRTLHHDLSVLGGPTQHGSQLHWVRQGLVHVIRNLFCHQSNGDSGPRQAPGWCGGERCWLPLEAERPWSGLPGLEKGYQMGLVKPPLQGHGWFLPCST